MIKTQTVNEQSADRKIIWAFDSQGPYWLF